MDTDNTLADSQILIRARACWNNRADQFNQWDALCFEEKAELIAKEQCLSGDIRYFLKSGNKVRLLEPNGNDWEVLRVNGDTAGKRMLCPSVSLVWCLPGQEEESIFQVEGDLALDK